MSMLVLTADEVRSLLDLDGLRDALRPAFVALSEGRVSVPPRTAAMARDGFLGVMPGHVAGLGLGAKLVSVFSGNERHGLPSHQALIALFDEGNGSPVALIDGTVVTAMRTAAASALATQLLARSEARVLAILGAGVQGETHLEAVPRVRDIVEIRVASRTPERARALAARDPRARAVDTFEAAVRGADVVCCCTDSASPVLARAWLDGGCHVTSVGATLHGGEVDAATVDAARVFVESRTAFSPPPAGAAELQSRDPESGTELGEVLSGRRPGRVDAGGLTLYKSMGHAVEDLAAAALVVRRARERGVGRSVDL